MFKSSCVPWKRASSCVPWKRAWLYGIWRHYDCQKYGEDFRVDVKIKWSAAQADTSTYQKGSPPKYDNCALCSFSWLTAAYGMAQFFFRFLRMFTPASKSLGNTTVKFIVRKLRLTSKWFFFISKQMNESWFHYILLRH